MTKLQNLEKKITTALNNPNVGSAELTELISQTEAAAEAADQTATQARAEAIDIATVDASAARQRVIVSELIRDRHKAILTKLRDKLAEVKSAEYAAKWEAAYRRTEAKRDALAAEFRETYLTTVAKLVDLFQRMATCDHECDAVNRSAPGGDDRRLKYCEVIARGLEDFSSYSPPILRELRLPEWERSRAWWPPQRQIDPAMFTAVPTDILPRRRSMVENSERGKRAASSGN